MSLSQSLFNAAKTEADRKRRLEDDARALDQKVQRKKLWEAFNPVCEYVPRGPADSAARTWAALFITACDQLRLAGEVGRLEAMRYRGSDPVRMAGTEAAFHVCNLACVGDIAEVRIALQTLIESAVDLDSPFRLFLESVRDNRRWWATVDTSVQQCAQQESEAPHKV